VIIKDFPVTIRPAAVLIACRLFFRSKRTQAILPFHSFNYDSYPIARRQHQRVGVIHVTRSQKR